MSSIFRFIFWPKDYQESIDFYKQDLALPLLSDWDRGPGNKGTIVDGGSGQIEILDIKPGKEVINPKGFEIYIEVPDVDEYYEYIKGKSIPILGELVVKPWGDKTFSIHDPNGIKLIFFQQGKNI